MRILILSALIAVSSVSVAAQPHVAGRVEVDPASGLIDGQLCVSRFAPRRSLRFVLSNVVNIKTVTDSAGTVLPYAGEYGGRIIGEAREYVVQQADTSLLLRQFCVDYRGAVPVFATNSATDDWKGRIISIRGTIRATEQSRWYPVLFDSSAARFESSVTYDVTATCLTCTGLYVNGARPVTGATARFTSSVPRDLLLLAGTFTFTETPDLTFVAGSAGPDASKAFSTTVREIATYYARILGRPYGERPTLMTFRSISRDRPEGVSNWQFVTWPTIGMAGAIAFDSVLATENGQRVVPRALWTTLSHEMGHYYFGTMLKPAGPLRWFALESMAEYLSLKAVRSLLGEVAGAARALNLVSNMGTTTLPTLDRITREDEITGTYRYQYAPAFLLTLEKKHGEEKMLRFLRALLDIPATAAIDYAALSRAAEAGGIPRSDFTAGWGVAEIRATLASDSRALLNRAVADPAAVTDAIGIAVALVGVDTMPPARLEALAALQRIVRRDSLKLDAQYQIGRISALTGQALDAGQSALELYLRHPAIGGNPSHAAAHWRLGMIEEHRGRTERARAAYRNALAVDPSYQAARDALVRLGAPPP